MGKKARKTRWRTLTIADDHSDSEESNNSVPRLPKPYQQKSYYERYGSNYSSQSTPRRRYQYDSSSKSTRSSSTTSENKITFNEDEYTKITTPRQDVLFKKGYLNKPKNYQTQTSTGTSTNSTGNSTGNGTPDHQSTDLEYESQFVFPNGFLDQNGIYYVNSYEPYPLMVYNPSTYYPEYNGKSKRYSTGSLSESMSPNNEETTSQDLSQSGGETSNNVSDYGGHQVYNMLYPGYYVNGVGPQNELVNGHYQNDSTKRVKKKRRRKTSKSQTAEGDTSEYTDDNDSPDEIYQKPHETHQTPNSLSSTVPSSSSSCTSHEDTSAKIAEVTKTEDEPKPQLEHEQKTAANDQNVITEPVTQNTDKELLPNPTLSTSSGDLKTDNSHTIENNPTPIEPNASNVANEVSPHAESCQTQQQKYNLKPDAEEFVPRAYRAVETHLPHPMPIKFLPPNFLPIPMVAMGEFNGQNFNHAFIPPGFPINFIPHQDPKMFPGYISYVPNQPYCPTESIHEVSNEPSTNSIETQQHQQQENNANIEESTVKDEVQIPPQTQQNNVNKTIDIATVVSKLEVAAKEQVESNNIEPETLQISSPNRNNLIQPSKPFRNNQRYRNSFKRTQYNKYKSSTRSEVDESAPKPTDNQHESSESVPTTATEVITFRDRTKIYTPSPERLKRTWKQNTYQNGSPKRQITNFTRPDLPKQTQNIKPTTKEYSDTLRKPQHATENTINKDSETKRIVASVKTPPISAPLSPAKPNQWISVSNRKKRKNKPNLETEDFEDFPESTNETDNNSELFESYDVSLLVDVIPPSKQQEEEQPKTEESVKETDEVKENSLEDLLSSIAKSESAKPLTNGESDIGFIIPEVSEIEKEMLVTVEIVKPELEPVVVETLVPEEVLPEIKELEETKPESESEEKFRSKKKSKKGTQKPLTKKVIITDIDLSMHEQEVKTPIKKIVKKISSTPEVKPKEVSTTKIEEATSSGKTEEVQNVTSETPEKKSKKKKKKPAKPVLNGSLSSSNATLSAVDDAYDFLLENSLLNESVEKTNDEISQEFDKIIQKGMYGNLEEKIKSLNVPEGDGFFKNVLKNISGGNNYSKHHDFNKIFQSTRHFLPPNSVSLEDTSKLSLDFNKIELSPLDSTAAEEQSGVFLENPDVAEILQESQQDQTVPNKSTTDEITTITLTDTTDSGETTLLDDCSTKYPITKAVRDWMSRTRESTPDVEILKSPNTIYKEFYGSDDDSTDDTITLSSQKTVTESGDRIRKDSKDEVTIFSVENSDLLDFWEDPTNNCDSGKEQGAKMCSEAEGCAKCQNANVIEQGEDAIEVYESKYGRNETFKQIQKEIEANTVKMNSNRANNKLPYTRAICCSLQ